MIGALLPVPGAPAHCRAIHPLGIGTYKPDTLPGEEPPPRQLRTPRKNRITLYIGDVGASARTAVLDTLLGSCVAVCLYEPSLRIGGMNHILLPSCHTGEVTARYGIHAMELLINEVMKLGGDRRRLIAKAFGGAAVIPGTRLPPIGESNARFVRAFLANENIPLVAERMGGDHAVHVYFHTDTGKATVHTVDGSTLSKVIRAERSFKKSPSPVGPFDGEITIF